MRWITGGLLAILLTVSVYAQAKPKSVCPAPVKAESFQACVAAQPDYSKPMLSTDSFKLVQGCDALSNCFFGTNGYAEVALTFKGTNNNYAPLYLFSLGGGGGGPALSSANVVSPDAGNNELSLFLMASGAGGDNTSALTTSNAGIIRLGTNSVGGMHFDSLGAPYRIWGSGNYTIDSLAGSGNAQVCADSTGKLYRGSPGC